MLKKVLVLLLFAGFMAHDGFSQADHVVTGKVVDQESGQGLPGVNIVVEGTSRGVISDVSGNFQIKANPNETLEFSYIGYTKEKVAVNDQSVINVTLVPDVTSLKEIVVVGYGEMKRSDVTGSVTSVQAKDLKVPVASSLDQALEGKAAGVVVSQSSGQPGGGISVNIRGVSSINGNNQPLYVVDGVPISGDARGTATGFAWAGGGNGQTAVNALSGINPSDIASIEVLKDASATAIYGSRAANGVVLITTKRGQAGQTKISYDGYYGVQRFPKKIDMMNLRQYAQYANEMADMYGWSRNPKFLNPSLLGEGTDWQDAIYDEAPVQDHNVSISGGTEKTRFALSLGYMDQEGIIIGSGFKRYSGRINLDHDATKWLKIGANLSVSQRKEKITLNDDVWGVVSLGLTETPDIPVKYPDGSWGGPIENQGTGTYNPVAIAEIRKLSLKRLGLMGNFFANATLLDGLVFTTKVGIDVSQTNNYAFNPTYKMGTLVNTLNQSNRNYAQNNYWIWTNFLTYTKQFDKLNFNLMVGQEAQQSDWEGMSGTRKNFITNDVQALNGGDASTASVSQYVGSHALSSYYGRLNLNYNDRYLLTSTFRYDGSSNFGEGHKWGFFPSFAVGWKISNEPFFSGIGAINNLKLRAGYGEVGNQDIPAFRYSTSLSNYETKWGTGLLASNFANPDLVWESTNSYNLGLDLGMFGNRIELITDVYLKSTDNLLMLLPLPMYMGTSGNGGISAPYINIGAMENKGVEVTLNTVNTTGQVKWNSGLTFTMNRNKITKLVNENAVIDRSAQFFDQVTRSEVGQPVGQFYGYVTEGIFQDQADINGHAKQNDKVDRYSGVWPGDIKFKDISGPDGKPDGVIDQNDKTFIGNPNPDFVIGFNNTVNYKNFDLTVFLYSKVGNDIYNFTRASIEDLEYGNNQSLNVVNRAKLGMHSGTDPDDISQVYVTNPDTDMPRLTPNDPNQNNRVSDRFVEDASYLRVKNVALGYSLPSSLLDRCHLTKLRVYVNLQNLFTLTNYSGYSPEIGPYNQDPFLAGVDNGNYPSPRIYTVGLNLGF